MLLRNIGAVLALLCCISDTDTAVPSASLRPRARAVVSVVYADKTDQVGRFCAGKQRVSIPATARCALFSTVAGASDDFFFLAGFRAPQDPIHHQHSQRGVVWAASRCRCPLRVVATTGTFDDCRSPKDPVAPTVEIAGRPFTPLVTLGRDAVQVCLRP